MTLLILHVCKCQYGWLIHICISEWMSECIFMCPYIWVPDYVCVCICVCYVYTYVPCKCMYVRFCMYDCENKCFYVCALDYTYLFICIYICSPFSIYVYHKYVYIGSLACMYMSTLHEHAICMYMCIVSNTCIKHMSVYMHLFVV